jgi:hypothetical protein
MEEKLQFIPKDWTKGQTWRLLKPASPSNNSEIPDENISSQWAISKREARSVLLFDIEYIELASIAENYQNTRAKPVLSTPIHPHLLVSDLFAGRGFGSKLQAANFLL